VHRELHRLPHRAFGGLAVTEEPEGAGVTIGQTRAQREPDAEALTERMTEKNRAATMSAAEAALVG